MYYILFSHSSSPSLLLSSIFSSELSPLQGLPCLQCLFQTTISLLNSSSPLAQMRCISESQHHRVVEVGRDLWRPSAPEQAAQDHVWVVFENLQGDSTTSLGILCQCSITHKAQKSCLMFIGSLLVCQFVPNASSPGAEH